MRRIIILSIVGVLALLGGVQAAEACCGPVEPPPDISDVECTPNLIWPPNHKYVQVDVLATTNTDGRWQVLNVVSDQPDNAGGVGDGDTLDDCILMNEGIPWLRDDGSMMGAGEVRAERCGVMAQQGVGRTYTFTVRAWNSVGETYSSCSVYVPHDRSGGA